MVLFLDPPTGKLEVKREPDPRQDAVTIARRTSLERVGADASASWRRLNQTHVAAQFGFRV